MSFDKRHISTADIRNFFFSKKNREFLIFLFFLALSGAFWLIVTLNEKYETEISVPIKYVGVPGNVVMMGSAEENITVRVQDRKFVLYSYLYDVLQPVKIDFASSASSKNGVGVLRHADIMRQLQKNLFGSTTIIGVKPETIKFYYNYGERKKVPVKVSGKLSAKGSYYISKISCIPDSVTVYAMRSRLDSIQSINTSPLNYPSVSDTLFVDAALEKMEGVKSVPSQVRVGIYTDILTEETVDVPIKTINLPAGKLLRTFPTRVKVSFVVGVSVFRNLDLSQFQVVADYSEIEKNPSEKCNIYLKKVPHGVKRPRLNVRKVDYLIEEVK